MLLACPGCQTPVRVDGRLRGARVRCGECGTTFRARRGETSPPAMFWGAAAALVALVALAAYLRRGSAAQERGPAAEVARAAPAASAPDAATEREVPAAPAPEPGDGWSSAPVQAAVALHEAAFAGDRAALVALLDAGAPDSPTAAAERLLGEDDPFAPRLWRPFDGAVASLADGEALVRLACAPRRGLAVGEDGELADQWAERWIEWRLVRAPAGAWHGVSWRRWVSPQEERVERPRSEAVVLSDGSRVVEHPLVRVEELDDTPPELRERIASLVATMLDLDLTRESAAAQAELVTIGRPAIPALLNGLVDHPIETQDDAIRCNQLVGCLRMITGQSFGFRPQLLEGSSVGTTEERRASALRQWFAWWDRSKDDFVARPTEEGRPDPTDRSR